MFILIRVPYQINKEKTSGKGTREETEKERSSNKRQHPKAQNANGES
jgi:hypothetical protein